MYLKEKAVPVHETFISIIMVHRCRCVSQLAVGAGFGLHLLDIVMIALQAKSNA